MMSPWLFINVYMNGVVREVNAWVLGKGLELLQCEWWQDEINQLLFGDDTALLADSEEKFCRLVSKFGRVCEWRKLRVNVGKSKVMRNSRSGKRGRIYVRLNGEPLKEVDCLKYLGSQVVADEECERDMLHRMNEEFRAWNALKSVLSNKGLRIHAKKCPYEGVIFPTVLH